MFWYMPYGNGFGFVSIASEMWSGSRKGFDLLVEMKHFMKKYRLCKLFILHVVQLLYKYLDDQFNH